MNSRDILKILNKRILSEDTGISYSRLRKYTTGQIKKLTKEEKKIIINYLFNLFTIMKKEGEQNDR